jgi:demethylmenaquinone methyltransferase/2-methoxy-6-polyprenyl-1,4-benzoquinol methylase
MSGTRPRGVVSEREAASYVRQMFAQVAPRYDLLNHLLSFNIDRYWRSAAVSELAEVLARPEAVAVDLACGTGDLTIALERNANAMVLGSDFCHPMLIAAKRKSPKTLPFFEADALRLPFRSGSIDLVTMAFGFRNLANYKSGMNEIRRVLRPGGIIAVLEFSTPPNPLFCRLYDFYSYNILPRVGRLISGSREAYTYLPESVRRFPDAEGFAQLMRDAGFSNVRYRRMTFGIVALHTGCA